MALGASIDALAVSGPIHVEKLPHTNICAFQGAAIDEKSRSWKE